jgi:hypothetical protein
MLSGRLQFDILAGKILHSSIALLLYGGEVDYRDFIFLILDESSFLPIPLNPLYLR